MNLYLGQGQGFPPVVPKQMAMSPTKRLFLVAFVLLCFISITARARSLRETTTVVAEKDDNTPSKSNHVKGGEQVDSDDLAAMDYTPAAKNPPIHN